MRQLADKREGGRATRPPPRTQQPTYGISVASGGQVLSPSEVDTVVRKLRTLAALIEACPGEFASNPSSFIGGVRP